MRKFTFLKSLLLTTILLMGSANVWAETVTIVPDKTTTGSNSSSYVTTSTNFTTQGIGWAINNWNPSTIQVRGNQSSVSANFQFSNTSAISGNITKITITRNAGTLVGSKIFLLTGSAEQTGTSSGIAGTMSGNNVEWTLSTTGVTYFKIYFTNGATSGTTTISNIIVEHTVPTITVTETSVPDMSTSVGDTDTETINVSGANLTGDIALAITGANAGMFEVSPATLTQTSGTVASTPVTITYRPTSSGAHTATLELTSAGAEKVTLTLNGTAISTAVNNVKITGLTAANGKVKFTASAGEKVQIFNSLGQTIVNQLSVDGLNEILLPNAKGVLVVKVGTKTAKVVL